MSQIEKNYKVQHLLEKHKFNEKEIGQLTDKQIEYFHWLYCEDSVYDYM